VYVTVEFQSSLPIETLLEINVSLRVSGDVPASAQGAQQSLNALVVDPSEHLSHDESGTVSGRYEVHSSYSSQGESCSLTGLSSGYELSIHEWGAPDVALARIRLPTGQIATASDGTGQNACIIEFSLEDVPEYSVYMVASLAVGQTDVCRACVLGLMTPTRNAEQVLVRQ
jgi:hypothetical protein